MGIFTNKKKVLNNLSDRVVSNLEGQVYSLLEFTYFLKILRVRITDYISQSIRIEDSQKND